MESTLSVKRKEFTDLSTIGDIFLDGEFQCHSLEDTFRKDSAKIPGKTAIPMGRYELVLSYSNRFGRILPLLLGVPGFEGIRIHPGNTQDDTEGCILVGHTKGPDWVGESRWAFRELYPKIEAALKARKVFVDIS